MHVRVSRVTGLTPDRFRDVVAAFQDSDYIEQLSALEDFAGYVLAGGVGSGVSSDGGKLLALSLWRTGQALQASDELADSARALRTMTERPARSPLVDRLEIILHRGGTVSNFLRLSRLPNLAPGAGEAVIDAYEHSDYLERLSQLPGFGGYLLLADPERRNVMAVSSWASRRDLGTSDELAESARALRIDAAQPAGDPIVDRYEVVLQRELDLSFSDA